MNFKLPLRFWYSLALLIILFVSLLSVYRSVATQAFSGNGSGTADDPFQISTCEQLQEIKDDHDAHYILVQNIDCTDTANWNSGLGFQPLYFTGYIDGRNHSITGLTINRPTEYTAGLFGNADWATIENIRLLTSGEGNVDIIGGTNVGAFAGELRQGSTLRNVHSNLSVQSHQNESGSTTVGGLVGLSRGNIFRSSSTGSVAPWLTNNEAGTVNVGGLVGINDSQPSDTTGTIDSSFFNGYIGLGMAEGAPVFGGTAHCGGIAGSLHYPATIKSSYSSGMVNCTAQNGSAGGLIGLMTQVPIGDTVQNNFSMASVTGPHTPGGLIGYMINSGVDVSSNYFDVTEAGTTVCTAGNPTACTGVNQDGSDPDFFKDPNSPVFGSWQQSEVWQIGPDLPSLREVQISPDPPTSLNAVRGESIELSWMAPMPVDGRSNNIHDYIIEYKRRGDVNWSTLDDGESTATSVTFTELTENVAYDFRVRAVNNVGQGLYSDVYSLGLSAPSQVTGLNGSTNAKVAELHWDKVPLASSYIVQYRKNSTDEWIRGFGFNNNEDAKAHIYELKPSTTYEFRVAAMNEAGQGPWSEALELTTTEQKAFIIKNCVELQAMREDVSAEFTLANDIDCSQTSEWNDGAGFEPISAFVGTFDGKGHTIKNLYINFQIPGTPENTNLNFGGVGLFGMAINAGIKNVRLLDSTVTASFALDEEADENENGIPDSIEIPTDMEDLQELANSNPTEIQQRALAAASLMGEIGTTGVGSVAGMVLGGGTYQNVTSDNAVVIGGVSGGVFGITMPYSVINQMTASFSSNVLHSEQALLENRLILSGLRASGAINGAVSGGLVGVMLSGSIDDSTSPHVVLSSSESTATVDSNIAGGLVGVSASLSELFNLFMIQNPAEVPSRVGKVFADLDVRIVDSIARGNVSTCSVITQVPVGGLGGVVGIGVGTELNNTKAYGNVTSCANDSSEIGIYGGALGGLAGGLAFSKIQDSQAHGRVGGIQSYKTNRSDEKLRIFAGTTGGLVGFMLSVSDPLEDTVIKNSIAAGSVKNEGGNGLFALSGGFAGVFIGNGTIKDSHAKGLIESSLSKDHYFGANISGGLLGLTLSGDTQSILSTVLGGSYIPSHGVIVNNSYATGDVKTSSAGGGIQASISGGMGGLLLGQASVINSHANGDVTSNISEGINVDTGNPFMPLGTQLAVSGGLFGLTAGVDQNQILSTFVDEDVSQGNGLFINNTYASGNIKGTISGGLVGFTELRTVINKSYASGNVRGTIVGGLVGGNGISSSAGVIGSAIALSSIDSTEMPQLAKSAVNRGVDMISPLIIRNTYTTGNITAVPLPVRLQQAGGAGPAAPFAFPSMAGGLVGFYAPPGGSVKDSYASGTIRVEEDPSLAPAAGDQIVIPKIANMVGGIFGLAIAVPKPDLPKIMNAGDSQLDIGDFLAAPMSVENVFAASQLNVPDKTLVGGVAGLFGSPFSAAWQDSVPTEKIYNIKNIYFDESQIKIQSCNGPRRPGLFFNELFEGLEIPENMEGEEPFIPEDSPVNVVLPFFKVAQCNSVNKENSNPGYFINNKTNPPLDKWDFDKTWVVQTNDYPKFVAGANTSNPVDPPTPIILTSNPPRTRTPPSGFGAGGPALNTLESPASLENFVEKWLPWLSEKLAKMIPYILLLLLIALALLYTYMSILEDKRRKKIQLLIGRFQASHAARAVYLKLTSHYINTPIATMQGALELLASLKQINPKTLHAAKSELAKLTGNAKMILSTAQDLSKRQEVEVNQVQSIKLPSIIRRPAVWLPVAIVLTLVIFVNFVFVKMDKYDPSLVNFATQIGLAVIGIVALIISYYFLNQSKRIKHAYQAQFDVEKSILEQQTYLIDSISTSLDNQLATLKQHESEMLTLKMGEKFNAGLRDLEYLVTRFGKLSLLAKNIPGLSWSTELNEVARKAIHDVDEYAKNSRVVIKPTMSKELFANIDPQSLHHLIYSSLENAVKYSSADSEVQFSSNVERNFVVITITDHGKGISSEDINRLFQPFSRLDSAEKFDDTGIGVDLYFSKVIVDNYGGTIVLKSQVGQGTTVKIRLPKSTRNK